MPNKDSQITPERCIYCRTAIRQDAIYCKECSKYQAWWKNWIPYISGAVAGFTLIGSLMIYGKTTLEAMKSEADQRQAQITQERSEVVISAFEQFDRIVSSTVSGWRKRLDFVTTVRQNHLIKEALEASRLVLLNEHCELIGDSEKCAVVFLDKDRRQESFPMSSSDLFSNITFLLSQLELYARSLKNLGLDSRRCELELDRLQNLLNTLDPPTTNLDETTLAAQLKNCKLISNSTNSAISDEVIFRISFEIINKSEKTFEDSVFEINRLLGVGVIEDILKLLPYENLEKARQRYEDEIQESATSRETLRAYISAASQFRNFAKPMSTDIGENLIVAHKKLRRMLSEGAPIYIDLKTLVQKAEDFDRRSELFADLFRDALTRGASK